MSRVKRTPETEEAASPDGAAHTVPLWKKLLLAAVAFLVTFAVLGGLAEVYLRIARPVWTLEDLRRQAVLYDSSIFCRHIVRKEVRKVKEMPHDMSQAIHINAKGYRGPEFSAEKPTGTVRTVVLGGSSVFGYSLKGAEADWPRRVEKRLRAMGHTKVECINAGVPGHATFDSLGRYLSEIRLYKPDWIVLYQSVNDFRYFTWLTPDATLLARYRAYRPDADPRINYLGWWDRLLCHSQLYTKVRTRYFEGKLRRPWERKPAGAQNAEGTPTEIDGKQPLPDGFDQFRLNVSLLCEAAHETGARVLLVTQARLAAKGREGLIDGPHLTSLEMDEPTLVDTFERCDAILRDVAKQKNAVFLDAAAEMSGEEKCFLDLIHLTDIGADRLADIVAAGMDPLLREGAE